MKNRQLLFLIAFTFLVIGCKAQNFKLAVSTLEKIQQLYTKDDEIYLKKLQIESIKFADSCEKNKLNCFFDPFEEFPSFAGGINKFRELVYKNTDQSKIEKPSKAKIKFTVEKNDKIVDILVHSDNSELRKEIFRVMNLDDVKNKYWKSGSIGNRKVLYLLEFDVEFKTNE